MRKMIKRFYGLVHLRDESGNILVFFAFSMVVLLGCVGLVVDGGRLYLEKSKLQKALDAAVLGGVQKIPSSQSEAITTAQNIAQKNAYSLSGSEITVTNNHIQASKTTTVPMTFAKVLGVEEVNVSAKAKAIVGKIKKINKGVVPLAVTKAAVEDKSNQLKALHPSKGNVGYLDFDTNGAQGLADAIENGVKRPVAIGDDIFTETGEKWGPVTDAIQSRIDADEGIEKCQSAATADKTCKRVIIVPVIEKLDGNGKHKVKVIGFAAYWLQGMQAVSDVKGKGNDNGNSNKKDKEKDKDKEIRGQFLKLIRPDEVDEIDETDPGEGGNYLHGVKLVE